MSKFSLMVCGLAVVLAASPAMAQRGGGGGGRGGGLGGRGGARAKVELAAVEAVQADLKATDEQKAKIAELADGVQAKRMELATANPAPEFPGQDATDAQRAEFAAKQAETQAKIVADLDAAFKDQLAAALDATQQKRLQEIYYRSIGLNGMLVHADVVAALALTDDQKNSIKTVLAEYPAVFGRGGGRGAGGGGGGGARGGANNAERDEKLMAILNDTQKAKVAELQGADFDVSQLRGGRGGRGGGGGGRGGRGGGAGGA